ncbi:MAG: cell shape-determining protein, partial [Gammaproteobacteria bacterium]|nr:cell shape-determining protein [Gammaproteobacteria bacterium]
TIAVTTPSGTVTSSANLFTYSVPTPTITAVSPNAGVAAGGTTITLTGTNFTGATAVYLGGTPLTSLQVSSATKMTGVTAAHAKGAVPIAITVGGVTTTASQNGYTYQ